MSRHTVMGRAALVLASIALAIGGAELAYRARLAAEDAPDGGDDGWRERYRRMNETIYRRSDDPELVYEPTPGSAIEMEYGRAAFNSVGLREDREFPEARGERRRVAMIGDSIVWGEFVALHDTLPRRTEEALGARFEVQNAGVTGYDTTQEARWYERTVRRFHPEVVVVVYCMNDMMIMSGPFERYATGADRARKDAQDALFEREAPVRRETIDWVLEQDERAATFRVLARAIGIWERARFADHYVDEYLLVGRDAERRERVRASLARLGSAIREDGALPMLAISPVLESWERYRWTELHAFVRGAAEDAGFRVLDPIENWRASEHPEVLRIGGDNLHYGRRGNAIFGRTIARAIEEALE